MDRSVSRAPDTTTRQSADDVLRHWLDVGQTDQAVAAAQRSDTVEILLNLLEERCAPLGLRDLHQAVMTILDDVPTQILMRSSDLPYWYGLALLSTAHFGDGQKILEAYEHTQRTSPEALIRGRLLVLQTIQQIFLGGYREALESARQAIAVLPADAHQELFRAWATREVLATHFGHSTESEQAFYQVLHTREHLPLDQHWWFNFVVPNRADMLLKSGRLIAANSLLESQLRISNDVDAPILRLRLALIALEQGDPVRAAALLAPLGEGIASPVKDAYWSLESALVQAAVEHQSGQTSQAIDRLYEIIKNRHLYGSPIEIMRPNIVLADIWIEQGQVTLAEHWLEMHTSGKDTWPRTFGHPVGRIVRANLAIAKQRWQDALDLLQSLVEDGRSRGQDGILVQVYAHIAFVYAQLGMDDLALQAVTDASACDKNDGFQQSYIVNGVDVRSFQLHPASRTLLQPEHNVEAVPVLSPREMEVLILIRAGLKNQEIADQLYIALSTVKNHIANIFHRLGTSSRVETVASAERWGLFDAPARSPLEEPSS